MFFVKLSGLYFSIKNYFYPQKKLHTPSENSQKVTNNYNFYIKLPFL